MIADQHGSRQVEGRESPDWFDITVTTTPFETGMILMLEDHENLSAGDAKAKLAELAETYPLAPVSGDDCDLESAAAKHDRHILGIHLSVRLGGEMSTPSKRRAPAQDRKGGTAAT